MTIKTIADLIAQGYEFDSAGKPEQVTITQDVVNAPNHYTFGGIETIDYLKAKMTPEEFMGYCKGNCLKYLSRAGRKDDVLQDYKKAAVYLGWLIADLETGKIK